MPWFREHGAASRPLWVLEREGQAIAWVRLNSYKDHPADRATAEASVYVAPEHQEQGTGTRLLAAMLEHSPRMGVRTVLGLVSTHNQRSLRRCARAGVAQWGYLLAVQVKAPDGVQVV